MKLLKKIGMFLIEPVRLASFIFFFAILIIVAAFLVCLMPLAAVALLLYGFYSSVRGLIYE